MDPDSVRVWIESMPSQDQPFDWVGLVVQTLLVFLAAFLGALGAFQVQVIQNRRNDAAIRLEAGRTAQFALITQWDFLVSVKKQLLDEHRSDPLRWAKILPFGAYVTLPTLDTASLGYLFRSGDPDLLSRLKSAEDKVQTTRGILSARNSEHILFQRRMSEAELAQGLGSIPGPVEAAVGPEVVERLRGLTDELYRNVDAGIRELRKAIEDLRTQLREMFPNEGLLDLDENGS